MQELKRDAASADNAELVARIEASYAAYNRRDWDAFLAHADPECEWAPVEEGVILRGHEAMTAGAENWLSTWEEFQWQPEEIELTPTGEQAFVALASWGRSKGSDAIIEGRFFHVIELRDGRLLRGKEYVDEAEARAAFERPEWTLPVDNVEIVRRFRSCLNTYPERDV